MLRTLVFLCLCSLVALVASELPQELFLNQCDLTVPPNYKRLSPPVTFGDAGEVIPLDLFVSMNVLQIEKVNDREQNLDMNVLLSMSWTDQNILSLGSFYSETLIPFTLFIDINSLTCIYATL